MRFLLLLCALALHTFSYAQNSALGQWTDHGSFNRIDEICFGNNTIFASSKQGVATFNLNDNSKDKITRIAGLSDIDIKTIAYKEADKLLVVGYENGNIDLIRDNSITSLQDIKRANITGEKSINKVVFFDDKAWLACSFGVVVLNLSKNEVLDSYRFGPNGANIAVYDLAFLNNTVYAATNQGVFYADTKNPFLANSQNWQLADLPANKTGIFSQIETFNGRVYANFNSQTDGNDKMYRTASNGVWENVAFGSYGCMNLSANADKLVLTRFYDVVVFNTELQSEQTFTISLDPNLVPFPRAAIYAYNTFWIGDSFSGFLKANSTTSFEQVMPNGPKTSNVFKPSSLGGYTYVASGGYTANYSNLFRRDGIFLYNNLNWQTTDRVSDTSYNNTADFVSVFIDPSNPKHTFASSWSSNVAVIESEDGKVINKFDKSNSTLEEVVGFAGTYRIAGAVLDRSKQLWVANAYTFNNLHLRTTDKTWRAYDLSQAITSPSRAAITQITAGFDGTIWLSVFNDGVIAFNNNKTPDNLADDKLKRLTISPSSGSLPSNDVFSVIEDLDGEIWVGTSTGFAILYNPSSVFSSDNVNFDQPIISQNGNFEKILANEQINNIAVDGANRKWMATQTSGVYLLNAEGNAEILHFTTQNSPLISDEVYGVSVDNLSGEVFFATSKGLQSFKSDATGSSFPIAENIEVYPNPVQANFDGTIAMRGFVYDADVKITDISGNVVYQTKSKGGSATWDGLNFRGEKVSTGVYLVFATNADGSQTTVGKILFIK